MKLNFLACSENEVFARNVVAAFALPLNPTLSELSDVKTAVSEAVTNCIVHAYPEKDGEHWVSVECETEKNRLHIIVTDSGKGIADVARAVEPFFTTLADEERSGMGFTIMQTFMSAFRLQSAPGAGTTVYMSKTFRSARKGAAFCEGMRGGTNAG